MSEFALSTSWNASRHRNAESMINEIKSAGFDKVELNFTLTKDIVNSILPMVKKGMIKVRSLHNYCPLPNSIKPNDASLDYYSLASLDDEKRKMAVRFTKDTIEKAAELKAEAVVLHCGKIEIEDSTRQLISLYEDNRNGTEEFNKIKHDMFLKRRFLAQPYIEKLLGCLDELNKFALQRKIILGIENRFYFMELPSFEEVAIILKRFKDSMIYYWHDVGHAEVFEKMGFANHLDFLKNYSPAMAGVHLHDIKGCKDHLAPGRGTFDFSILKPFIKNGVIKIIEAHKTETIDDIKHAKEYISRILGVGTASV